MKLEFDCVRDVLLFLNEYPSYVVDEENDVRPNPVWIGQICEALPKYDKATIFYTLAKLDEAGFIKISKQWASGSLSGCAVNSITYDGHEFLGKIQSEEIWIKTKSAASKVGTFSLQAIGKIAEGITSALISKFIPGN